MEQDESPLGRVYRELGLPVIGEGRYASTSYDPRATLPQGPLEQVRRWLDPNYAANRQLLAEQDLGLHRLATAGPLIQGTRNLERPTLADAQSQYPDFPVPPLAYERAGPGGGYDMTTPLPPTFQALLQAKHHNTSLRQPGANQPSAELAKYYDALQAGHDAWMEQNPGKQPSKQDILKIQQQAAGAYEKLPVPGSSADISAGAKAKIDTAEAAARPEKLAGESDKNTAEIARLHQEYQNEEKLAPYKLDKLKAEIQLAITQASTVGQKAALGEMLANLKEAQGKLGAIAAGAKYGLMDNTQAAKALSDIYNSIGGKLEMVAPDRAWFERNIPGLRESAVRLQPRSGQPQAQETSKPEVTPPSGDRFKGAPKGKNPGALLKDSSGQPVARWDGSQWIPLEGQ